MVSSQSEIHNNVSYLGLHVTEPITRIYELIDVGLKEILAAFPGAESAKHLSGLITSNTFENAENYKQLWKYSKESKAWHVTTLFKKGKSMPKSHPAVQNFEEGKKVHISIKGIAFVP